MHCSCSLAAMQSWDWHGSFLHVSLLSAPCGLLIVEFLIICVQTPTTLYSGPGRINCTLYDKLQRILHYTAFLHRAHLVCTCSQPTTQALYTTLLGPLGS